jgi:hypothetical protein
VVAVSLKNLFDPAFQGLAISLMGGTITSTFLTLLVVPLLYFKVFKKENFKRNKKVSNNVTQGDSRQKQL